MTAKEFFTNEMEKQWQERTSAFSSDFGSLSRIPYVVHPAIYKVMEGYAAEQLKQERNKAVDEAVNEFNRLGGTWSAKQISEKLESLKH